MARPAGRLLFAEGLGGGAVCSDDGGHGSSIIRGLPLDPDDAGGGGGANWSDCGGHVGSAGGRLPLDSDDAGGGTVAFLPVAFLIRSGCGRRDRCRRAWRCCRLFRRWQSWEFHF